MSLTTYLETIYGRGSGYVHLSTTKRQLAAVECSAVAELAEVIDGRRDVYLSAAVVGTEKGSGAGGRIVDADAAELTALWADLDRAGEPGHKTDAALWTRDDIGKLWEWLPIKPTAMVDSGGGWWPWFALAEPVPLNTDGPGELLLARWARWWESIGAEFGRQVDSVFNPGRIARAPGSINTKAGRERPAVVKSIDPSRVYTLEELDALLPAPEPPVPGGVGIDWSRWNGDRPGDTYNRETTVSKMVALLEGHGFHSPKPKGGRVDLTRAGKAARDGHSVTVWPDASVTFWSSAAEALPGKIELRDRNRASGTYDPFGVFVHAEHGGDFEAAARALNPRFEVKVPDRDRADAPSDDRPTGWDFQPGGSWALDIPEEVPTVWAEGEKIAWAEGEPLLVAGTDGSGKTVLGWNLGLRLAGVITEPLLGMEVARRRRVLYLAQDRPRQAQRALRRMLGTMDRDPLNDALLVVDRPLPLLEDDPEILVKLAREAEADVVIVDSLKDVTRELSKEETGAAVKRAFALCVSEGIDVAANHHDRKAQDSKRRMLKLSDVYGSRLITAGCGSVLALNGGSGDPVVELRQLKQVVEEVGPLSMTFDFDTGLVSILEGSDPLGIVMAAKDGISAQDAARLLYQTDKPTRAERERARRSLDRLVKHGLARVEAGDRTTNRPSTYHPPMTFTETFTLPESGSTLHGVTAPSRKTL